LFNDLIDGDPDRPWGTGPVTLAGDAAHAMLPSMAQGANQALEDAAALLALPQALTQRQIESLYRGDD
jgi:salicylate hydroxylase